MFEQNILAPALTSIVVAPSPTQSPNGIIKASVETVV